MNFPHTIALTSIALLGANTLPNEIHAHNHPEAMTKLHPSHGHDGTIC